MKKIAVITDKKLKLNKTTIIKLNAANLGKIWGGSPGNGSTTPNCNTTQGETDLLLTTL